MSFETSLYDDLEDEPIISFALAPSITTAVPTLSKNVKKPQESIPSPVQEMTLEMTPNTSSNLVENEENGEFTVASW